MTGSQTITALIIKSLFTFIVILLVLGAVSCSRQNTVIVRFHTNGGSAIESVEIDVDRFSLPEVPTKEGYVFDGWFLDSDHTQAFMDEALAKGGTVDLYARWKLPLNTFRIVEVSRENGSLEISILLTGDVMMNGYDVVLTYDDTVLQFVTYTDMIGNTVNTTRSGEIKIVHVDALNTLTSETNLISISFMILEEVETTLSLEIVETIYVNQTYEILEIDSVSNDLTINLEN